MGQAREKLKVFENVMARVGLNGNFLEEYFKGLSTINGLQTMAEMTPPPMGNTIPPNGQNVDNIPQTPQNGAIVPPMGDSGGNGLEMA